MKAFFTLILLLFVGYFTLGQTVTRDTTFNLNQSTSNGDVRSMVIQNNGKIIIAGTYTNYDGSSVTAYVGRLDTGGVYDNSFVPPSIDNYVNSIAVQPWDNKIIIAGPFTKVNGISRNGIARLNPDGTLDATFNPGTGFGAGSDGARQIWKVIVKDDPNPANRKIIVGGQFGSYNGFMTGDRGGVVQLNTNGSRDASYNPQVNSGGVYDMALDRFGKLVIVGEFWYVGSTFQNRIARLNADGTLDTSFSLAGYGNSWGPYSTVTSVAIDNHDRILFGGAFTQYSGQPFGGMARLNSNGSYDASFNIGTGLQSGLYNGNANGGTEATDFYVTPDNKIIVVGNFSKFNGTPANNVVAVNDDGSLNAINFGTGFNNVPSNIGLQSLPSGSHLVFSGFFSSYNGQSQGSVVRTFPIPSPTPLPVDLTYAAANIKNNDVVLYWKTAMSASTDRFQIMKSTDGRNFHVIQEMNEPGTLRDGDKYTFVDKNVSGQHLYYLIKVIHADGKESVSRTLTADIKNGNFKVQAYSDLASHTFHIATQTDKPVIEEVRMFTVGGQLMKKATLSVGAGSSENILDGGFVGSGKYVLLSVMIKETGQVYSFTLMR